MDENVFIYVDDQRAITVKKELCNTEAKHTKSQKDYEKLKTQKLQKKNHQYIQELSLKMHNDYI